AARKGNSLVTSAGIRAAPPSRRQRVRAQAVPQPTKTTGTSKPIGIRWRLELPTEVRRPVPTPPCARTYASRPRCRRVERHPVTHARGGEHDLLAHTRRKGTERMRRLNFLDDEPWDEVDDDYRVRWFGHPFATDMLGASLWEFLPGSPASPLHMHYG